MDTSAVINVNVSSTNTPAAQYKTIILKPNYVEEVNTLTQLMVSQPNTKYVIKYDYVLGNDIIVPNNCILEFDGGSISGAYKFNISNCILIGKNKNELNLGGIIVSGSIKMFNINYVLHNNALISCVTLADSVSNAQFKNCNFLINNPEITTYDASCIFIDGASNVTIDNCYFSGAKITENSNHGAIYANGASNIKITNCKSTNCYHENINLVDCSDCIISNNVVYDTGLTDDVNSGYSGIATTGGTNISIINNIVYNTGASCVSFNSPNSICSDNIIHNARKANGIACGHNTDNNAAHDSIISNNRISYCQFGVGCGNCPGIIISGNSFSNITENAIVLSLYSSYRANQNIITICDNQFNESIAYYGIHIFTDCAQDFCIKNNSFNAIANNYAIDISTTGIIDICGNTIVGGRGIRVGGINGTTNYNRININKNRINVVTGNAICLSNFYKAFIANNEIFDRVASPIIVNNDFGSTTDELDITISNNDVDYYKNENEQDPSGWLYLITVESGVVSKNDNVINVNNNTIQIYNTNAFYGRFVTSSVNCNKNYGANTINGRYHPCDIGTVRPTFLSGSKDTREGYPFYDLTNHKMLYFTYIGDVDTWVDATGNQV